MPHDTDSVFHGWMAVEYSADGYFGVSSWAYEDSGGPIVVGDTGMVPSPLYPTIQSAIDAASEGDVIRIAPGVHQEAVDFQGKAITLVGDVEDPSSVVLDGTGLVDTSVVRMVTGEGAGSILRGVTIRNGTGGEPFYGGLAGAAIATTESSPVIEDCLFEDNRCDYGGAIHARKGAPTFRRCVFRGNEASEDGGGFMFSRTEGGVLEDCVFEGNVAGRNGGAVHLFGDAPGVVGCVLDGNVAGNAGGGISWASTGEPASITGTTIVNNQAVIGGGVWIAGAEADLAISGSAICDNSPEQIDGPFVDGGGNDFCDCPADYNGDGYVTAADLGAWLLYAGSDCTPGEPCPGDLDGDGEVTGGDLGVLLLIWGVCD